MTDILVVQTPGGTSRIAADRISVFAKNGVPRSRVKQIAKELGSWIISQSPKLGLYNFGVQPTSKEALDRLVEAAARHPEIEKALLTPLAKFLDTPLGN